MSEKQVKIKAQNLTMGYDSFVLQQDMNFEVKENDIFIIMGGSGCGKSSLLRLLTGLSKPLSGDIFINGINLNQADEFQKKSLMTQSGILYQSGALFSSMTLAQNVALPLEQYTSFDNKTIQEIVSFKLALVGLAGFEEFYPSQISGGMKKRAGLARALALDPEILYFDEPSAGLDPVSSKLLDDLILNINHSLGTTMVIVTHELSSIFSIGTNGIFLDAQTKQIIAQGNPNELLKNCQNETVLEFLTRGNTLK